jgi:serine/threonine protein phosphatase PrpC
MKPGEMLIAASDGLETLEEAIIANILHENSDSPPRDVANVLADAVIARRKPQQDNVSIVVAEVKKKSRMGLF